MNRILMLKSMARVNKVRVSRGRVSKTTTKNMVKGSSNNKISEIIMMEMSG